jgi:hypothetical protein
MKIQATNGLTFSIAVHFFFPSIFPLCVYKLTYFLLRNAWFQPVSAVSSIVDNPTVVLEMLKDGF